MSLPPVVSDPERCPKNPSTWQPGVWLPHRWDQVHRAEGQASPVPRCRYCGGRKP